MQTIYLRIQLLIAGLFVLGSLGKEGDQCHGEGRTAYCERPEICRESKCKIHKFQLGCDNDLNCPSGHVCYKSKCLQFMKEEERIKFLKDEWMRQQK